MKDRMDSRNDASELGRKAPTGITPTIPQPTEVIHPEPVIEPSPGPENDSKGVGGIGPSYSFKLNYLDQRGYFWEGLFDCHVLTVRERVSLGLTRARMMSGVPLQSIDQATLNILEMQAHIAVVIEKGPKWLAKLADFHEVGVLTAIYREVASYEARFWGAVNESTGEVDENAE